MARRTTSRITTMAAEAITALLTSCRQTQAPTNATVGSAVSNEPRAPPNADESRSRIRDSTVCAVASMGDSVMVSSLVATDRLDLVGRVEDRGYAVLEGHAPVRGQIGPRDDPSDAPTAEPDEVQGLAAVVQLHHERRDIDSRSKGHAADGAPDACVGAVRKVGDRGGAQAPGVLLQLAILELGGSAGQARGKTGEQLGSGALDRALISCHD